MSGFVPQPSLQFYTGVSMLAGYLTTAADETLVFSIMVNNSDRSSQELIQAIDEIVMLFNKLETKTLKDCSYSQQNQE